MTYMLAFILQNFVEGFILYIIIIINSLLQTNVHIHVKKKYIYIQYRVKKKI